MTLDDCILNAARLCGQCGSLAERQAAIREALKEYTDAVKWLVDSANSYRNRCCDPYCEICDDIADIFRDALAPFEEPGALKGTK